VVHAPGALLPGKRTKVIFDEGGGGGGTEPMWALWKENRVLPQWRIEKKTEFKITFNKRVKERLIL
jgi:hypothetical protein